MGYYTKYTLEITDSNTLNIIPNSEIIDDLYDDYSVSLDEDCKWYDHEENMIEFSKKYPKYYFYFRNKGELNEDLWYSLFYNGSLLRKETLDIQFPNLLNLIKNECENND